MSEISRYKDNIIMNIAVIKQSRKKLVYLTGRQLKLLGLNPDTTAILHIGGIPIPVCIERVKSNKPINTLHVTSAIVDSIPDYNYEPLALLFSSPGIIALGPSVGINISRNAWMKIRTNAPIKKRALLAQKKGILLYFFELRMVNWKTNTVKAYGLNPGTETWVLKTIPVPEIIYDRGAIPSPNSVDTFCSKGSVRGIQWLNNTRVFGKWEVYRKLQLTSSKSLLPETSLLNIASLEKYIANYSHNYVKSNYGRNGRKVGRIEKTSSGYCWKTGGSIVTTKHFKTLQDLFVFLIDFHGPIAIIQQSIHLAKFGQSPFDMRVLIQKDGQNNWQVSGINFRIGCPGAIVTNYSAGATDMFFAPGSSSFPNIGVTWQEIEDVALTITHNMEHAFGSLGEIGLDLGVDNNRNLKLIEVNSIPSSIAYRMAPSKACRQIFGLPLDYTIFLARRKYLTQWH